MWALETVKFAGDGEDSELFTAIPHVMDAQLIADDLKEEPGYMTTGFDSMVVSWFDLEHFEEDRCAKPDTSMVGWFDLEHCDQDFECHGSGFDIDMHHQLYMPVGCNPDKIHHSRVTSSPAAEHDSSEGPWLTSVRYPRMQLNKSSRTEFPRVGGPDLLTGLKPMIMEIARKAAKRWRRHWLNSSGEDSDFE